MTTYQRSNNPSTTFSKINPRQVGQNKFITVQRRKNYRITEKTILPDAVKKQAHLYEKYKYEYRQIANGNVENNSTLYLNTGVAHHHQIEQLFVEAIENAKRMPEIFGRDFECDVQVNLVRSWDGKYLGYAYADLSNPALYYALIGFNPDGTERANYIDDPNWIPVVKELDNEPAKKADVFSSWADDVEEEEKNKKVLESLSPPKIRKELPPLLMLGEYEYDTEQKEHLRTDTSHGNISVSPAFISPGVDNRYDDCALYVSEIPDEPSGNVLDFLYAIFARYSRTTVVASDSRYFFPKIAVRRSNKDVLYATVSYSHPYDAKFAFTMLRKIRAKYEGKDVEMHVRSAIRNN